MRKTVAAIIKIKKLEKKVTEDPTIRRPDNV